MKRNREVVEIVFRRGSTTPQVIIEGLFKYLADFTSSPMFSYNDNSSDFYKLCKKISKQKDGFSRVNSEGLSFSFSGIFGTNLSALFIEEIHGPTKHVWEKIIGVFRSHLGFIQAWVSDTEYNFWQNAKDPIHYKVKELSFHHLPMKSNGLPYPLEALEIDISKNPGRYEIKENYIEAVGYRMWFSTLFWKEVGIDKLDRLLESKEFKCSRLENDVIEVLAGQKSFSDNSTEKIQNELRKILYG